MTRKRVETGDLFADDGPFGDEYYDKLEAAAAAAYATDHPPTIEEAHALGAAAQQRVEENANEQWLAAARLWIARLPAGARFVSGDVWVAVEAAGFRTTNRKAVGPVIARAAKQGLIERSGLAACRTSHGSLRAEWTRR